MPFITKLDFSSNRQVKQYEKLFTSLSGGTQFGIPYSSLTKGPDITTTAITQTYTNLVSTFSGNSATTVFSWYDSNMAIAENTLSPITPLNSATTQNTGVVFIANTSGTTVDGYTYAIDYSGVSFDIVGLAMIDLGGGAYSGSVHTNILEYYSAGTIDYSGRTIWVDVSGITRTEDLIISKSPQIGYVWKCVDSEGKGGWSPDLSGYTSYWTAGTLTNSIVPINNTAGNNKLGINIDPQTVFDLITTNGLMRTFINESNPVNSFFSSGNTSGFTQIIALNDDGSGGNIGLSIGTLGTNQNSYLGYGNGGESFIYASVESDGLNIIENYSGSHPNKNNFIRFYAGANPSTSQPHIHIQGSGVTRGYVALSGNSPTQTLDVNGNARFRSIGSSASAGALHYTSDGTLTTNTSDIRLKENINSISKALDVIKGLSGVTYQWKDKYSGGDSVRYGFIAQQVESIEPKLTFTNPVDQYMGIHTNDIIPILVEAIKELTAGEVTSGNTYLETQSILAEDNNIDLNYGGSQQTAVEGGIRVLHALGQDLSAELLTDIEGNWKTNNDFKPKAITIPTYTPSGSTDTNGSIGNLTRDEDYLYVKTSSGWRRSNLQSF